MCTLNSCHVVEFFIPHVRREVHLTGIARHHVTFEDLLLVETESVLSSKYQDLIIHRLTGQPFTCEHDNIKTHLLQT